MLRREGPAPSRAKPEPPDDSFLGSLKHAGAAMQRYQEAGKFKEGEETPLSRALRAGQQQMEAPEAAT